jgi:hypothetical protein
MHASRRRRRLRLAAETILGLLFWLILLHALTSIGTR